MQRGDCRELRSSGRIWHAQCLLGAGSFLGSRFFFVFPVFERPGVA